MKGVRGKPLRKRLPLQYYLMPNIRKDALQLLCRCESAGQYSNIALGTALDRGAFSDADRALLTALVYGVIERRLTLDACIDGLSDRGELDLETRMLLRIGIYQSAFMDRIPDHAAVNETVAVAPKRSRGFVNAILRAFLRSGKQIPYPDPEADPIGYLSVRYSFLPALCECFLQEFGMARTEALLAAFCNKPPLTLRANTLRTTREALIERLRIFGTDPTPTKESDCGICLSGASPTALPGFDTGDFFVQDEASQLAVKALDARSGMRVLDVCSCPGSKAFGAAIDMQNKGEIVACDLHKNKLSLITSSAERLGISIIQTLARDAREPNPDWHAGFDRVLCDVPCSGFGVFAKKPELRYKNPAESVALPAIQAAILETASAYPKHGGRLVYSTCTLLPAENERNIARFLNGHPEYTLLEERTLTPDRDGTDGFYFAVLEKKQ